MTNNNVADLQNVGAKPVKIKRTVAHRYIKSKSKTGYRILREYSANNEDPICLTIKEAYNLITQHENCCAYQFYQTNKLFLPIAGKMMAELIEHSFYDLSDKVGTPVSELIKSMEEQGIPMLCVDASVANHAFKLIYARTISNLTKKYWEDLPNGAKLLTNSDDDFENLCSTLKIGRRTRAGIARKKINYEPTLQELTDRLAEKKYKNN
jgi:hypothetical protein